MDTTPQALANRIITGIIKKPGMSYTTLEAHSSKLGIQPRVFEAAMSLVQASRQVHAKTLKGDIVYVLPILPSRKLPATRPDYDFPNLEGTPIPFYDPKEDGPTPCYSKETRLFYKKQNELLKRVLSLPGHDTRTAS